MTNPNNAIGTNGAYSGRTSVDAFNDVLSAFNGRGIVSGWSVSPSSGMTITLGGVTGIRDVAIAVATGGSRTTINNRSGSPVSLTIDAAPATNSRIDSIVAYVSNPPQGTTELADNPNACGLIAVKGTVASSPTAPTESMIRSAITADGAVGSTAYYVVLGTVKVVAGVTTITSNYITQGAKAGIGTNNIADKAVTSDKIDFTTLADMVIPSSGYAALNSIGTKSIDISSTPTGANFLCISSGHMQIQNGSSGDVYWEYGSESSNYIWGNAQSGNLGLVATPFTSIHVFKKVAGTNSVVFHAERSGTSSSAECFFRMWVIKL